MQRWVDFAVVWRSSRFAHSLFISDIPEICEGPFFEPRRGLTTASKQRLKSQVRFSVNPYYPINPLLACFSQHIVLYARCVAHHLRRVALRRQIV